MMSSINDDTDNLPEDFVKKSQSARKVLEEDFGKANADLLIKGKVGRPISQNPKQQVTLRIDSDILAEFRSHGKGWQTEINAILREWVEDRTN